MSNAIHLESVNQFKKEVLEFDGSVVLDFYADRCGPCQMILPFMEELAAENKDKNVKIIKANVDNESIQDIVQKFQVSAIPSVFIIKSGKVVQHLSGANPKETYQAEIDKTLEE